MVAPKKKDDDAGGLIQIPQLQENIVDVHILGTSPLVMNRLAEKARQQLLLPPRRINRAQREGTLKHNPLQEFRSSMYQVRREVDPPARLHFPCNAFASAMATAALELPGASKASINRLVSVPTPQVYVYGTPQIFSAIVRQAGAARTPDVRTRSIIPRWAAKLQIRYVTNRLLQKDVANLFAGAGILIGIGDGRKEKGHGLSFGSWRICSADDPEYREIIRTGGRAAQDAAIEKPAYWDDETQELLEWFDQELIRREQAPPPADIEDEPETEPDEEV
jgi:hypothetical protein